MKNRIIFISLAVVLALSVGLIGCGGEEVPEIPEYNLAISSTEGGEVTTPGEDTYTYDEGEMVDLAAEADEGYQFANWTGDVDTIGNVNATTTTITMDDHYSITANFVAVYDLNISSTAGGLVTTPGEGIFTYDEGTDVDLVAEAEDGYQFVNWTGDVETIAYVNTPTTTIIIQGDYEITANFEYTSSVQYDLTVVSLCGGSVDIPNEGTSSYNAGEVVDLVATADAGYQFINWTGDVDGIGNVDAASTTVYMNDDYFIIANFREETSFFARGALDPQGWWQYNSDPGDEWCEELFISSPDRFIRDYSKEGDWLGGPSGFYGSPCTFARIYFMFAQTEGEEHRVIVAAWGDEHVFEAAVFPDTEENVEALIYGSMELDGPSGEFDQFVRDTIELSNDVIRGSTIECEASP